MGSVTLADLRTRARRRADMEYSAFVTDTECNALLNESGALLWEKMASGPAATADRLTTSANVTLTGASVALPASLWLVRGIDWLPGGTTQDAVPMRPIPFGERHRWRSGTMQGRIVTPPRSYTLIGSTLYVWPEAQAAGVYRIWYVPEWTDLSSDSSSVTWPNHWEEFIVIDTAMKLLQKEDSDVSVLAAQRAAVEARIMSVAPERDTGAPRRITDADTSEMWW